MDRESRTIILNYPISSLSEDGCLSVIVKWIWGAAQAKYFVCANPHSLEVAQKDAEFDLAIRHADLVVPDGVGIVIASKILGGSIRERVTGMDIFLGLSETLNKEKGRRYFFLGSTEQNLMKIREKMYLDFPNIIVAGTYSPPFNTAFSEEDNKLMVDAINQSAPDVLWVGMTAPKQEKWIQQNKDRLKVKFIGAIGAVFDFYTGNVKRSHPIFQKLGLEWLPRLLREPRRLGRRNFISNPSFLLRVIRKKLSP
jgi:N-acetylglucosaminyldiphosphoundecaprenol N-acetyl-beta-D-mannosaminyltransferase